MFKAEIEKQERLDAEERRIRQYGTAEELTAFLDKRYPRMAEPDAEGIDLHPADPRRRFIAVEEGAEFRKAEPLTKEDLAELDRLKKRMQAGK